MYTFLPCLRHERVCDRTFAAPLSLITDWQCRLTLLPTPPAAGACRYRADLYELQRKYKKRFRSLTGTAARFDPRAPREEGEAAAEARCFHCGHGTQQPHAEIMQT